MIEFVDDKQILNSEIVRQYFKDTGIEHEDDEEIYHNAILTGADAYEKELMKSPHRILELLQRRAAPQSAKRADSTRELRGRAQSARTIWKFSIMIADEQIVVMPEGAQILSVQVQHDALCLWAMVDPDAPTTRVKIRVYGTGHPIKAENFIGFIDTVQTDEGNLVWHVFKEK